MTTRSFLYSSPKDFQKSYQEYLDRSDEYKSMISCIKKGDKAVMKKLVSQIQSPSPISVLGVGSGTGEMDLEILQDLAQAWHEVNPDHKSSILCRVIEPTRASLEAFRGSVEVLPPNLANIAEMKFEWHQETFEQYTAQQAHDTTKFDIVHFVQSIYAFVDLESTLTHCYEKLLGDRGVIICILMSKGSFMEKYARQFQDKGKYTVPDSKLHCNEDVLAVARKKKWSFEEYYDNFSLDSTHIFDDTSDQGGSLLDFITQILNFRTSVSREEVQEVVEFFGQISGPQQGGKRLAGGKTAAVVIKKGFE